MKREYIFTFSDVDEALLFMDMITKRIKSKSLMIKNQKIGSNVRVKVAIESNAAEVELLQDELRRIYRDVKMAKSNTGIRSFDISIILNKARLSAAIPFDLIVDLLQLMGKRAEFTGSKLKVDMDLESLIALIEKVSSIYKELINTKVSSQAKRIIAIYSILKGKNVKDSINDLLEYGLLTRYGDSAFLVMALDYEHALIRLQSVIEKQ